MHIENYDILMKNRYRYEGTGEIQDILEGVDEFS